MKICKGMGIAWVVVMLAATAGAETVLVDFGNSSSYRGASVSNPDQNGRHWNSVHSGAFYANMVDTANAATTIDLGFDTGGASDSYNGPAGATTQPPTPAELAATAFDAAALGALGATNAVFDYYVNSRFQLQGLDANRTYRLTFFGSHKYSTDNTTTYSLCSDNTYATVLASTNLDVQVPGSTWLHNSNRVAVLAGAAPQAGGVFYVKFLGTNGNNGYLNAMMIELEKATPTLGVSVSRSVEQGTASVTLTGRVSGANGTVVPANGETVGVTINGVTQNATVGGGAGAFSVAYNTASLTAGTYTITYAYAGNATSLNGATNAATALTVLPRYETVLIDMANDSAFRSVSVSNPDSNGRYWNSVHGAAYYADMVNKSNVATRVDLGFDAGSSDSYNGPAGATTQPPTPSELAATAFDAAALGELGVTNAVFDYYVNARFQVQGLETGLSYRLTFYGAHKYSTDDATVYGLCTDSTYATTTATVTLNVQVPGSANLHNSNTVAVMAGASPQADGKFYVSMNGANGHSGYLNAMKVEWEKVTAAISGVSASQTNAYGTSSVTLTGVVGAANVPGRAGEVVGVTINGVTSNATVSGDGAFSVVFPVSGVAAGTHTVTYAYTGSTVLLGATNAATALTVTKVTPVIGVRASQSVEAGTSSVTLTGVVSGAGGIYPANGSTVGVTINGVTQNATVGGGAGAFSVAYTTASLTAGTYTITYAYAGNATSLNGATNAATALTVLPRYETVLIDMANDSAFRSVSVSNPDSNGRYWNSVHGAAYYADMVNKSNVATRVDLGFDAGSSDSYNGPAGATTQPPTPSELAATAFDAAALGELGVTNAVFDYYVNARFQVQGLETGLSYRLTFYGAHKYSTDDATVYGLCTDNTYATTTTTVSLNVQVPGSANLHNSNTVAVMAGASPQADGKFYVSMNGANGHSGYLNAMKVEWEKVTAAISGVSASQTNAYGTASVTLTGVVGAANVPGRAGEVVGVTINGVTSNATVSGDGAFSVVFPVSGVAAGSHTITYAYAGSTVLLGATNAATTLTVTKVTPVIGVRASQGVEAGTASVTLTGVVSGAGGIYPANGSTVGVTINGVTQNATVGGGAGAFSVAYNTASLTAGTYTITYAYTGNATSLNGATNAATALTVLPRYETVLIDLANDSAFRSVSVSNPDSNGRYWNSVHGAAYYADMVNKSNVATRVDLGFDAGSSDSYNGPAGATTQPPTPSELAATAFDAAALGELGVTNAVFDYYVNARFQVQGLETGLSYRLTFYGAHKYSTDDATVYGLCTDNTYATTTTTVSLNVQVPGSANLHNSNTVAVMAGASPQADGKFYVSMNGANGHSGYLNAMKVEWEKVTAAISGVSASQTNAYGTASVTLTGVVGAANVPGRAGEVVGVTINGVTSNATVSGDGAFSVVFPVSGVAAGSHTITYAYAGSTVLLGATNAATTLTVTKVTPVIGVRASQGVEAGTASVTLTGVVSGAGGIYPANGSTVGVTINGVTQNATVGGGAGAFSVAYDTASLTAGTYTITYAYTGNATSLNGATNASTTLTVTQGDTILVDFGRHDATNGNATVSPDVNGNHWNNMSSRVGDNIVTNGTRISGLDTVGGASTPVAIEITSGGWKANGRFNGGLFSPNGPSGALLGDFAVETATEDYLFVEGAGLTETFRISGLNASSTYNLRFFGTRAIGSPRATTYTVGGSSVLLTTSGTGIGNNGVYTGNDDEIVALNNLTPNGSGEINVSVTATTGGFGYIGILEITDNGGFCVDNTPVSLPNPGNQAVLATGSATLSFSVTATDGAGCTAPGLSASGLPSGATFTNSASGNSRTGFFSWTPTGGQVGTYPVRFTATDVNEAGSTSVVMLVYVGQSGEGSNGNGVPNSQTNWHVVITNMQVPSSGNITVVWTSVDGITYDIYQSDQNYGGAMTWTRVVSSTNASGSQEDAAVSMTVSQRYFQVVPAGGSPISNGVWAVIRPTVNASTFTLVSPGTAGDRAFDGALGSNLAQVLTGHSGGVGDNVGDEVFILEANQSWRNLYLDASGVWRESGGGVSTFELAAGQGFQVLRNSGGAAHPRFTGPVGNLGTSTNVITDNSGNGGWNLITFSQGKHIPISSAFGSLAEGSPEANWDETQADLVLVLNSNGSWRRIMRAGDGTWFDLSTFATATIQFGPGTAVFYYRQPVGTMRVRF